MNKNIIADLTQEIQQEGQPFKELFDQIKSQMAKAPLENTIAPRVVLDPIVIDSLEEIANSLQETLSRDLKGTALAGDLLEMDKGIFEGYRENVGAFQDQENVNPKAVERDSKVLDLDKQAQADTEQLLDTLGDAMMQKSEMIALFKKVVNENRQEQTSDQKVGFDKEQKNAFDGLMEPINKGVKNSNPAGEQSKENQNVSKPSKKKGPSL